ncbi:MAG: Trifunctional nucleotide phosphoesterase protein YfkN [Anaerolineales bacterium]|nr:Trifunctional nucleotide phosphoesterase protein YfkN [Anaerolineales bacterium]
MIEQQRQASEHILVLDAGNFLIGDRDPAVRTQGQTSVELMNLMGYDVVALGAKDLELGPDVLKQRITEAKFTVLSANAIDVNTGSRFVDPFTIVEIDQYRIGIVGISGALATDQIQVHDPLRATRAAVAQLASQTDIIIVLSNAGDNLNRSIAAQIPDVDFVIGAAGRVTPRIVEAGGGLFVQADQASPGHAGRYVGVADLQIDSQGNLLESKWERVVLSPEIADDPEFLQWAAEHR